MEAYNFIVLKKPFGSWRLQFKKKQTLKNRRDEHDFTMDPCAHVETKRS